MNDQVTFKNINDFHFTDKSGGFCLHECSADQVGELSFTMGGTVTNTHAIAVISFKDRSGVTMQIDVAKAPVQIKNASKLYSDQSISFDEFRGIMTIEPKTDTEMREAMDSKFQKKTPIEKAESENHWHEQFQTLRQKQKEIGLHPMKKSHEENRELLDRFMSIFRIAPEEDKKWLVREPLFPKGMNFSRPFETRETTRPLHFVFFLGDSDLLKELMPYLSKADFEMEGPYNSSFLHMLISGIEHGAPQVSAVECAEIFLSEASNLRYKPNCLSKTPKDYAEHLLIKGCYKGSELALKELLNVITDQSA